MTRCVWRPSLGASESAGATSNWSDVFSAVEKARVGTVAGTTRASDSESNTQTFSFPNAGEHVTIDRNTGVTTGIKKLSENRWLGANDPLCLEVGDGISGFGFRTVAAQATE